MFFFLFAHFVSLFKIKAASEISLYFLCANIITEENVYGNLFAKTPVLDALEFSVGVSK